MVSLLGNVKEEDDTKVKLEEHKCEHVIASLRGDRTPQGAGARCSCQVDVKAEVKAEADVKAEGDVKTEVKTESLEVKNEIKTENSEVKNEIKTETVAKTEIKDEEQLESTGNATLRVARPLSESIDVLQSSELCEDNAQDLHSSSTLNFEHPEAEANTNTPSHPTTSVSNHNKDEDNHAAAVKPEPMNTVVVNKKRPTRTRRAVEGGSSRATRATASTSMIPVLREAHADHELRTIVQVMSSMDARIAALKQATEDAENIRAEATRSLAALGLRRELEQAERTEAGGVDEDSGGRGGGSGGFRVQRVRKEWRGVEGKGNGGR